MEFKNPISALLKLPFSSFGSAAFKKNANSNFVILLFIKDLSRIHRWGILCIALFSISLATWGQTKTWDGGAGTLLWTDGNNWDPDGVPATGNDVVVNNAVNISNVPTISLNSLSFTRSVTLTSAAGSTITINNTNGTVALNISNNRTLTLGNGTAGAAVNLTFQNINTATTIIGTLTNTANNNITVNASQILTISGTFDASAGTVLVNGTISNSGIVNGTSGSLSFGASSTYIHARNNGVIPIATWNSLSNCNITGITNTEPTGLSQSFGDLTWNCASQNGNLNLDMSATINGTFSVSSTGTGEIRIARSADQSLNINNFILSGGILTLARGPVTCNMNVSGNFTMSGGSMNTSNNGGLGYGNIVFNKVGTQVYSKTGGTISSTIDFTVNSGSNLDLGTSLIDGSSGNFTLTSGATLTTANAFGIATIGTNTGSIQVAGTRTYSTGASYVYNGTALQISGTGMPGTVYNLTINNALGVNLTNTGNLTINGDFLLTNGTLNVGNTNINTLGSSACGAGSILTTGGLFSLTGIGNTNLPQGTYTNLTLNRTGTAVITACGPVSVSGALTLTAGRVALGNNNLTLGIAGTVGGTLNASAMVATNGTGQFVKNFDIDDTPAFTFPIGDISGAAEYSPVTLDFSTNSVAGTVGLRVTDATHPFINSGSTPVDYLSRYWTFSTSGLTNYTYNVGTYQYIATDIIGSEPSLKLSYWNGSIWTTITNSSTSGNSLIISSSLTQASGPLNGNAFTGRTEPCTGDIVNPTITCPGVITQNVDAGVCNASVIVPNATIADNCSVATLTWAMTGVTTANSPALGINQVGTYTFNSGVTTVTYTVTDAAGNVATCNFTVTITDNILPTITCPGVITQNVGAGVCNASVVVPNPTTGDNCVVSDVTWALTGATVANSPVAGINYLGTYIFNAGVTTATYTVKDAAGNSATCNFTVTITDIINPTITCPGAIGQNVGAGVCNASVLVPNATIADNCAVTALTWTMTGATIANSAPAGINQVGTYTFNAGITTVTYTVKDAAGNTATCNFAITITDNLIPNAICKNISVMRDALGNATITPADINNGSTDNCAIATLSLDKSSFTSADPSPQTVTLTVTDVNGNSNTCTSTVTLIGTVPPAAYYSYQTGNWNKKSTWTTDPGGTTGPGTSIPGINDKVVILSGRTVTLNMDTIALNIDLTINSGGILDMSTHSFTNGLAALKGGGILKLSSSNFPAAPINTFVTTDAGTTEYNNNGDMSATQATYYHLIVRSAGAVTQVNNITLNGNLDIKQGTFQINDANTRRLSLIINGDVTVDNGTNIKVGTGTTNTVTTPVTGINGTTGVFLNYYELQSHRVQIYGNFINNGTVKFSNLFNPVYDQFPSDGFATVYFQGATDKTLNCNGQTDFYNIIVDKGTDQTFKLTIYSAAYNKFRLFGANTSDGDNTAPASAADPNLKKALWIKNGTLVLQGLLVIPSLSEGAIAGPPSSNFVIPSKGALLLDGAGVIVLSTADDFTEVDAAYGITPAGTNAGYGINTSGGNSGISILGKLQVNTGYLSTRESPGLNYWSYAPGQFILNGGKVDTKQFHNPEGTNVGLISYVQNGGNLILRGRFINTISYATPASLANPTISSTRTANGIDATAGIGTFSISSNPANAFSMAGGTISIYDVCNTSGTPYAFLINCLVSNINVTGGTVQILPTTGSGTDSNYLINSIAPFNNLIINRASGAALVQLNTNPLVVRNDLTLASGVFDANNLDVTIGGNYSIASGTTYTTGTNTTIFNGIATQTFTVNLAAPISLNKLTIDKPAGRVLTLNGSQSTINISSDFRLVAGILNDNGKIVNIAGNVYNSGIHIGAGAGKIVLNGTGLQSIDGNGVFRNIDFFNTNTAEAPVTLAANMTVKGVLNLANDKRFNIGMHNLKLDSAASVSNYSTSRYIQTSGNSGDGGVTKVYTSSASFIFPVGAPTIIPSLLVKYTPATIGFSSDPATFGSITVTPVGYEYPATTVNNLSLTYYWKVRSSGFTGFASKVTHVFKYDDSDIAGTEANYIPALFNIATNSWNYGQTTDINTLSNLINDWTSPGSSTSFIDADYTAGDISAFGSPKIYYSYQSGLWSNTATWSLTSHIANDPPATAPGVNDIVIIGNGHTVNLYNDAAYPLNTATVSCASLQIATGSVLDIGNNPGSVFSMVKNHPSGNGKFRITATKAVDVPASRVSLFSFPANSDFSDFNVNLGTTEFYTTTNIGNSLYILPPISYVGNMLLSPFGGAGSGDNMTLQNVSSLTIYGDLTTTGTTAYSAIGLSWNTNNAFYANQATYTTIEKTVTVKGNLNINGGSFTYYDDIAPQHLIVEGNVNIAATNGACILVWDSGYGYTPYQNGATLANSLAIGGNLVNNGVTNGVFSGLNLTTPAADASPHYIDLTFFGPSNATVSGTGNISVRNVTVNKGFSQGTTLDLTNGGTMTTLNNNWLTLQNGTLRYMRTNPNSDFTISTTTPFSIPATAGLYIDLPSNTGNRNILIGNAANNNGDLLLSGKLTIIRGNVYVGSVGGADANNNDIEYSSSLASEIDIQGGNLFVNGQIRRNPSNAGGVLKYKQSGASSSVTINGQAAISTNAKFEILNGGSEFTMSNGTLTLVRGNGATVTPSTPFGDLYLRPETGSVTGGTIIFSPGAAAPQNFSLDANTPIYNLTIAGAVGQAATVHLLVSPLVINGNTTINTNSVLDANNINVTFNGNLINTPGTGAYVFGTNLTTFSSSGAQLITGATDFYDLVVNAGTSLTLSNPSTIGRNLTISHGNFTLGANPVSVKGDFRNDAGYLDVDASGNGITLDGTTLQHITGTGYYSRLTLNNAAGATIENDITLNEDLTMTLGILDIKKNLVSLGVNSLIQGAPFSAAKMITSDGVFSNVGLRKFFNTGAQPSFLYPIGTSGKYTPALLNITASGSVGYVRINNINSRHPAVLNPANALDYYWEVQSSGITAFSGSLVLNYYEEDVLGDEANYKTARVIVPGTAWSLSPGVDPVLNKISSTYTLSNNLSGEYTAGTTASFFTDIPIFRSNSNGNWTDKNIWTQTGGDLYTLTGAPNGFIVIINHVVTLDANFCSAYRTTINNKLKVTSGFFGHNLGTVDGSGTLYLESGSFPAGVFTTFLACGNNATVEYGGNGTYTIVADLYDNIAKIVFSGEGVRVLPNKDLTICNQLKIDGALSTSLTLDNSVFNKKLIIQGTMERYGAGGYFNSGSSAGATVSFAGTGLQNIGGALGDFTGTNAFNNFEINNSAGLHVNAGAIEVEGNLLLTSGLINTGPGRSLTITNSIINCVIPSGGSTNSFIDGPLIKSISQYDNFLFPVGKAGTPNVLGNNINISSTQTGPLLWSAEYRIPNTTAPNITAPLMGVSAQEFYTVKTTSGSQSTLNLNWTPNSDVTPTITGGVSNIRLARYDTGTSKWVEIPTSASGTTSGTATSTVFVTTSASGSDDYTLGAITDLKPRAKLSPTGPVCGASSIPVSFTAPYTINLNYTLSYMKDGVAQTPVTVSSLPYNLPTTGPGVYKLTDFIYDIPATSKVGVVDAGTVTVYAVPTASNAGLDQTLCGITTTNLTGNAPGVGSGLWSIVSGVGGNIISPAVATSQFIGLNGVSYTLRWTISSGTCISSDDVVINFTILPSAPSAPAAQSFCAGATVANLVATPPGGCTVDWFIDASGGVKLALGTVLVSGTTYYAESNGGCVSLTRTPVVVTVNPRPVPTLNGITPVCVNSTGNVYTTDAAKSNYSWFVVGGFISSGGSNTDNTATVTWTTPGIQTISVNYETAAGCAAASPTVYNVTVNPLPAVPTLGAITQPTCAVPTGSVSLSGLPAAGTWTVTESIGSTTITGTGSTGIFSGLAANSYTFTVTDGITSCTSAPSGNTVINAVPAVPAVPIASVTIQPTCAVPTGTIVVTAPIGAFEYNVDGGAYQASVTFAGLAPGSHTLTTHLIASPTCISASTAPLTVNAQPATPTAPVLGLITQPTCVLATGSVALSGLPAAGTWTVTESIGSTTITGSGTTGTFSGLASNTYTFTVTNAAGCTSVASLPATVNAQPATPTAPVLGLITQPTCVLATGSVALSGLPAAGTWTVTESIGSTTITGSGTTGTFSGLASNTYTFTVTNAAGCTSVASLPATVNAQPATPTAPVLGLITQPTCVLATGSVALSGLPAAGTWTVTESIGSTTITGSGTTGTFSGLASNTYTFTVTNAAGCTSVASLPATVNAQPATPTAPVLGLITQPTCVLATGSVALSGLPAAGTWTVTESIGSTTITGSGTTGTFSGLASNTYTFTVTNAAGCTSVASLPATVNAQPATPTAPVLGLITQPTCVLATGSVALSGLPAAGTWTVTESIGSTTITGSGTTGTFSGLASNTYTFTVTNAAGCTSVASLPATVNAQPATPTAPVLGLITQPTCVLATGSVALSGLPAAGTWTVTESIGSTTITGSGTTGTFSGLASNTYTFTVTNAAGCTSVASLPATVNAQPATPTAPVLGLITQPTCVLATGSVALSGLPAAGTWTVTESIGSTTITGSGTTGTFSGLASNTYTFTVTNAAGCTSVASLPATVNAQPATPTAPVLGLITQPTCVLATGSVALSGLPAAGTWTVTESIGSTTITGSGTTGTFSGLASNTYTFTVTNAAGCTSVASLPATVNAQPATPTAPVLGLITQPTCVLATGSVALSGLPAAGTWTVTESIGSTTITGSGTTGTFSGLASNTYTFTVTNAAGCTSVASLPATVNAQPATPTAPVLGLITQPTCVLATGSVALSGLPAAGTWTVTESIGSTTITGSGTTGTFSGLASNTYTFTVTNAAGCTSVASLPATVNAQPATPTAPVLGLITQPTCVLATGSVALSGLPAAGTWTVTESIGSTTITGSGTTGTFSGLASNTYTFTVTNAAGCTSVASLPATVNAQPATPTAPVLGLITQPTCVLATGSVALSGLPAAGTWTVTESIGSTTITGSGTTGTFSGLASNTYTFTVTNAAGCTSVASLPATVNAQPATPTAPVLGLITQPTCVLATGSVALSGLPAAGTWTVTESIGSTTITGSGTTGTFSGLASNTYTFTVTNAAGCTSVASLPATVNAQPATPTAPVLGLITQPTCVLATGSVALSGLPAAGTWTVTESIGSTTITGSGTTGTFSGLASNTYTFTVTNAAGCTSVASLPATVNAQPATPTAPVLGLITQPTCVLATGSVALSGLPAAGTWTVTESIGSTTITGSGTTGTFSGLASNTYTFTVTNAAGCTSVASLPATVNAQPATPTAPVLGLITQPTCVLATGSVALSGLPAAGTWTVTESIGSTTITGSGTTGTFSGLASNTYTFTVTNAAGCTSVASLPATVNAQPATPTAPVLGLITQPTCVLATGSVALSGLPAAGTWTVTESIGSTTITGSGTTGTFSGLASNTYTFTVTNAAGCTSVASLPATVNAQPATPTAPVLGLITQPTCVLATGSVALSGLPAAGTWTVTESIGSTTITGSGTTGTFSGLASNTYTFTVTNAAGCTSVASLPATVNAQPATPTAPVLGLITQPTCVLATGSVALSGLPAAGTWTVTESIGSTTITGSGTTGTFSGLASNTYTFTVTNAAGCTSVASLPATVNAQPATPTAPVLGLITQPTCVLATGSVALSGLPAAGTWTVTESIGSTTITGSGTTGTFSGLASNTYTFTVTNAAGCTSVASLPATVNAQPATPTAPVLGLITQPTCVLATGSVALSGLPAAGTWTVTESIGSTTITGSGTTGTFSGLASNTYTFTVTNAAGCTSVASLPATVNAQPATPTAPVLGLITQPTCVLATGSVALSGLPAAGTWTVTESIGSTTITGSGTTGTFSGLASNTYTFTVTNAAGCTSVASLPATVNAQPATPTAPVLGLITQPTCVLATGSVALSGLPAAGTWTVTESIGSTTITGSGTTGTFSGLASNTYTFTVTNAAGCTSVASLPATVNAQPATPTAPVLGLITQPTCVLATGSVALSGLPAAGTWTVTESIGSTTITGSGTTGTFSGLASNTYTFTVTNAAGCTSVASLPATVNAQPATPTVIITNPAAVCSPSTIDITAAGVTAGSTAGLTLTYWTDAAATLSYATPTTAAAGTYYIKGADPVTGCYDIKPVTVTVNSIPAGSVTVVNVQCFGIVSGAVDLTVTGGTPGYTFNWNNGAVTEDLSNVAAGSYSVSITDANSCTATANATITQPASALTGTISSQTNVSVNGGNDGSVVVNGVGGTSPYMYKLGSGTYQVSDTFNSLIAGSYTVTVQDNNLCTFDVPVTITQPLAPLTGSITSQTNVSCSGTSTGSVTVAGSGGLAPYEYVLDAGSYQASGTFGTIAAGTYTVTVRDALLSTFAVSVTITQPALPVAGFIVSQANILCFGGNTGSLTVAGSGGTAPYLYKIGSGSYQLSGTFGTLVAGTYSVTVQDANLCTSSVSVTITQTAAILSGSIIAQTNVSCSGSANGSVTVSGAGGTSPYMYSLNGGTFQVSGIFNGLTAAVYTIAVRDANLCTLNVTATITEPAVLATSSAVTSATCPGEPDGSIDLAITGGTQPYSAIWSDGVITQNRLNIPDGTYSVVVTDFNGCATSLNVVVGFVGSESCIEVPQVITPNNDGFNDTWKIKNIDLFPNAEVFVFTRWGKLVFNTKNIPANEWNGTFKGQPLPTDSYHYILHLNDGSQPRSGVISIIR